MMSDDERAFLESAPDELTVYRGCYEHNLDGLSWSLDRSIAAGFTNFGRYNHDALPPVLLAGRCKKARCVLKLDRGEFEVITSHVYDVQHVGTPAMVAA